MTSVLVDSNILLDIFQGGVHAEWSRYALASAGSRMPLFVNPVIWSEIAVRFDSEASLNTLLRGLAVRKRELSFEAAFMAGLAHGRYRRAGGVRERTLPDFLIGAHAAHEDHTLLTRDPARYRTYFPDLALIAPDTHP